MPSHCEEVMIYKFVGASRCNALARSVVRHASTSVSAKSIPQITKPLGIEQVTRPNQDTRSRIQKMKDFVDYDKNLQRREEIKAELASSKFTPMHRFGDVKGKFWQFPAAYSRADRSLFMPNITGRTLLSSDPVSLTTLCNDKVSIVRIFSNTVADRHTLSYFLENAFNMNENGFRVIHINAVENYVKELLVRTAVRSLRKQFDDTHRWSHYMIARSSLTKELRASIMADNIFGGYIYLLDRNGKIRWAACGEATPEERANLWRYVKVLQNE
jgi:mitochondrial ATPase complex subunit ATP10